MSVLASFNVKGGKVFKEEPSACPYCTSRDIKALEVLGAHKEALFWECDKCGTRMLRFSKKYTEMLINKAQKLYFDMESQYEA